MRDRLLWRLIERFLPRLKPSVLAVAQILIGIGGLGGALLLFSDGKTTEAYAAAVTAFGVIASGWGALLNAWKTEENASLATAAKLEAGVAYGMVQQQQQQIAAMRAR